MNTNKPSTFEQLVCSELDKRNALTEASLGRLVKHLNNRDPIAIITGYRSDQTARANSSANAQIALALRQHGFGFHKAVGGYIENVTRPDGSVEQVEVDGERVMIVYTTPNRQQQMFTLVKSLGHGFKQDSVLLVDSDRQACWYYTNDTGSRKRGDVDRLGEFHPVRIGKYFTKIGKKSFTFKSLEEDVKWNWTTVEMRTNDQMRRNLQIASKLGVDYYEYLDRSE